MSVVNCEDLKYVNCRNCGRMLLGDSYSEWWANMTMKARKKFPPPPSGRVDGAPYCHKCIGPAKVALALKPLPRTVR